MSEPSAESEMRAHTRLQRSEPMPHMEIHISTEAHDELKRQAALQAKQMKRLLAEIVERALLPIAPPIDPTPSSGVQTISEGRYTGGSSPSALHSNSDTPTTGE